MSIRIGIGLDVFGAGIDANAQTIYNRIIADGGVSNLTRLNFFVKGLKAIYGDLANVPVCYDAHWIGYKLGSGTGATVGQAAAKLYSIKNTENLLTFSEQFDNAVWAKTGVTITANSVNSPTGTLTADLVTPTISDAKFTQGFIPTSAMQHNFSIYLRSATGSSFSTVLRITRDSPFSNVANTVITVTTEWQRFDLTFTTLDATTHQATIGGASTLSTGENLYAWGAQLNTGSVALPYTQTTTTAETLADAVQATAASQPLLLAHNGASSDNYLYAGPGSDVAGAYCQTSTNVSPQVNTNFTFEFNFKDFNSRGILGGCPTGSSDGWSLQIQGGTNLLRLYVRNLLVNTAIDSTTAITVTGNRWVKVVRSGNDYSFFEKADGGTYTQVGTTITNLIVLNSYNLPIQIGDGFRANYISIGCKILRARFYNDATATNLVVDFNPATYNAATSQTQWTSSTGEIWTISTGTAAVGYKGVLVDRVIVQGDGVDDQLKTTSVSITTSSRYSAINPFVLTSGYMIAGLNGGTGDRQLTYLSGTTLREYSLGSQINYSGFVASKLQMFQSTYNGASSQVSVNNANNVTGTLTADVIDTLVLFSNLSSAYKNMTLNTLVIPSVIDNATTRTATYNLLKTLNNL